MHTLLILLYFVSMTNKSEQTLMMSRGHFVMYLLQLFYIQSNNQRINEIYIIKKAPPHSLVLATTNASLLGMGMSMAFGGVFCCCSYSLYSSKYSLIFKITKIPKNVLFFTQKLTFKHATWFFLVDD